MDIPIEHAKFIAELSVLHAAGGAAEVLHKVGVTHLSYIPSLMLYCDRYDDDCARTIFSAVIARISDMGNSEPF
jgi:hypothetical protein